ncbi:MAG: hypothetical protein COU11_01190 [Candidatus Harrisonbacteria bacterium CG10_big_fil_rev_8_21_14_0_10_49_15]|uniref:Major facilitator superfamily (MFS) profile domain-containing protein n=1 Tax=Candidatus Harrisonbacteria bacterium CG10_big_fil_rev_8_21_14_0_10_49_15 TaxID=1974587 RepID=A0A2H0UNK7_9BACT|nr:MAG: hypothetical protein COU11_01190 [Candidatus Harrisonbacteria bacterium CG10_big_fil_rev_8_21_14_0_10_49_15]
MGIFALLVSIPLDSSMFARVPRGGELNLATLRNATSMGAQAIIFGILALLINVFHVGFLLAITGTFTVFAINALAITYKKANPS